MNYGFIEQFIDELGKKFHIKEIAFDRWGAVQMVQKLEGMGFTIVPVSYTHLDVYKRQAYVWSGHEREL